MSKWSKEDRGVFDKSEVMRNLEKKYLELILKAANLITVKANISTKVQNAASAANGITVLERANS